MGSLVGPTAPGSQAAKRPPAQPCLFRLPERPSRPHCLQLFPVVLGAVWASQSLCNRAPQTGWLQTADVYCPAVREEARSLRGRAGFPEEESVLPQLLGAPRPAAALLLSLPPSSQGQLCLCVSQRIRAPAHSAEASSSLIMSATARYPNKDIWALEVSEGLDLNISFLGDTVQPIKVG